MMRKNNMRSQDISLNHPLMKFCIFMTFVGGCIMNIQQYVVEYGNSAVLIGAPIGIFLYIMFYKMNGEFMKKKKYQSKNEERNVEKENPLEVIFPTTPPSVDVEIIDKAIEEVYFPEKKKK